jgi:acyl-CoA synthetase (AMP-forming)/AMP-acid ligase II
MHGPLMSPNDPNRTCRARRASVGPMDRGIGPSYADVKETARRFSSALLSLGIAPGDRVATMAMKQWFQR